MFRRFRAAISSLWHTAQVPPRHALPDDPRAIPAAARERRTALDARLADAAKLAQAGRITDAIDRYKAIGLEDPHRAAAGLCEAARAAQRTARVSTEWSDEILPPPMPPAHRAEAIAYLRAALEFQPDRTGALIGLARLLPAGDDDERIKLLETAIAQDRNARRACLDLGDAHFIRGETDKAAAAILPYDKDAYRRLIHLYESTGDAAAAREYRRRESQRPPKPSGRTRDIPGPRGASGPAWCVVANVRETRPAGPGGELQRHGTKHFPPGAKVYCDQPHWGDGYEKILVLGLARGPGRRKWIRVVLPARALHNARAKVVHDPAALRRLDSRWNDSAATEIAESLAQSINSHETPAT